MNENYEFLGMLGGGAFGEVMKARSKKTMEVVAVKKMKQMYPTWEKCLELRELKSLKALRKHENIVSLKEVVRENNSELYFVFEFMDSDLYSVMKSHSDCKLAFSIAKVRSITYQLLSALAFTHKHGYMHRDVKPENVLISKDCVVKLADFGLAREIRSCPPLTDYVSTRWYRSPDQLLSNRNYNSPIDLWATGCILVELLLGRNIFAGTSNTDQLCRICSVLGTPTSENWNAGLQMTSKMQFNFPKCDKVPWEVILADVSFENSSVRDSVIDLVSQLLCYDPNRRITAAQAMAHSFFTGGSTDPIVPPKVPLAAVRHSDDGSKVAKRHSEALLYPSVVKRHECEKNVSSSRSTIPTTGRVARRATSMLDVKRGSDLTLTREDLSIEDMIRLASPTGGSTCDNEVTSQSARVPSASSSSSISGTKGDDTLDDLLEEVMG